MIDEKLLSILTCPINHTPLSVADEGTIARLNRAIAAGRVKTSSGQKVEQPLDGGLLREDKAILFPIRDGIPVLLADDAIAMSQIE